MLVLLVLAFAGGFAACWFGKDEIVATIALVRAKI